MWLEGEGGGLPYPFPKLEKSALILGKNAMIVVICGLNFSFKMKFCGVLQEEKVEIFPCGVFLSRVVHDCLSKYPDSKKTPLPKNS